MKNKSSLFTMSHFYLRVKHFQYVFTALLNDVKILNLVNVTHIINMYVHNNCTQCKKKPMLITQVHQHLTYMQQFHNFANEITPTEQFGGVKQCPL